MLLHMREAAKTNRCVVYSRNIADKFQRDRFLKMSLPPEKITELKQIIHSQLNQV